MEYLQKEGDTKKIYKAKDLSAKTWRLEVSHLKRQVNAFGQDWETWTKPPIKLLVVWFGWNNQVE